MKYKPLHPAEIDQDWNPLGLSPQSMGLLKQFSIDHMAQKLGLSTTGKARLWLLLNGGQAGMIDGKPFVRAGPNMHSFPVPLRDWERIEKLLSPSRRAKAD